MTNKNEHEYRVAKCYSAWNHAGKIHRVQLQRRICSSLHYEGIWRAAGYSSTHAYRQHYTELSCRIHIPAALPLGKTPTGNTEYATGWIPELVWMLLQNRNIFRCCWQSIYDCSVVQSVDSSVYRLHSPVSRTYIFVFRTVCLNRHGRYRLELLGTKCFGVFRNAVFEETQHVGQCLKHMF